MADNKEFIISRVFEAPRELVFRMWSEVDHLKNWWGPKGFEISYAKLDFRPGGAFHYNMRSPEGFEMWGKFVFQEMEAPEKIVYVNSFSDPDGNIVRAPFSESIPKEIRNRVTFSQKEDKTELTLRSGPIHATEEEHRFLPNGHRYRQPSIRPCPAWK